MSDLHQLFADDSTDEQVLNLILSWNEVDSRLWDTQFLANDGLLTTSLIECIRKSFYKSTFVLLFGVKVDPTQNVLLCPPLVHALAKFQTLNCAAKPWPTEWFDTIQHLLNRFIEYQRVSNELSISSQYFTDSTCSCEQDILEQMCLYLHHCFQMFVQLHGARRGIFRVWLLFYDATQKIVSNARYCGNSSLRSIGSKKKRVRSSRYGFANEICRFDSPADAIKIAIVSKDMTALVHACKNNSMSKITVEILNLAFDFDTDLEMLCFLLLKYNQYFEQRNAKELETMAKYNATLLDRFLKKLLELPLNDKNFENFCVNEPWTPQKCVFRAQKNVKDEVGLTEDEHLTRQPFCGHQEEDNGLREYDATFEILHDVDDYQSDNYHDVKRGWTVHSPWVYMAYQIGKSFRDGLIPFHGADFRNDVFPKRLHSLQRQMTNSESILKILHVSEGVSPKLLKQCFWKTVLACIMKLCYFCQDYEHHELFIGSPHVCDMNFDFLANNLNTIKLLQKLIVKLFCIENDSCAMETLALFHSVGFSQTWSHFVGMDRFFMEWTKLLYWLLEMDPTFLNGLLINESHQLVILQMTKIRLHDPIHGKSVFEVNKLCSEQMEMFLTWKENINDLQATVFAFKNQVASENPLEKFEQNLLLWIWLHHQCHEQLKMESKFHFTMMQNELQQVRFDNDTSNVVIGSKRALM